MRIRREKMSDLNWVEIRFDEYCPKCKHEKTDEVKDPCNECLAYGLGMNSAVPVLFEEKAKK
jgi:hypothetical protein